MNEKQFLTELERSLKRIPKDERLDMLQDYREHFAVGKEEGKTEEEIARALGQPNKIAKEMQATYHLEKAQSDTSTGNVLRAVWAGISIGFFNLIIVLAPFSVIASLVITGWVVGVVFIASPFLALIDNVLLSVAIEWFSLFLSLLVCGLGIFIAVGMFHVTRLVKKGVIRYLQFNKSLVKGGSTA